MKKNLKITKLEKKWLYFDCWDTLYCKLTNSWKLAYIESLMLFLSKINLVPINNRNSYFKYDINKVKYDWNDLYWHEKIENIMYEVIWKEKVLNMSIGNFLSDSINYLKQEYNKLKWNKKLEISKILND